jgi:hypothetical protein
MGKWTELHEASYRGEDEELQRLLDAGSYDVNEGDDDKYMVCEEEERERGEMVKPLEVFEERARARQREREREG